MDQVHCNVSVLLETDFGTTEDSSIVGEVDLDKLRSFSSDFSLSVKERRCSCVYCDFILCFNGHFTRQIVYVYNSFTFNENHV